MNLTTTYLGLELEHPIIPAASPLAASLDSIRRMEDAGAAAVVMHSLYEEQIEGDSHLLDHYLGVGGSNFIEALSYFPEMDNYGIGPHQYVELIRQAKDTVDIPIIASLNGVSPGGWTRYAKMIEEAGADALELNVYYMPTELTIGSMEVEQIYVNIVQQVKNQVSIPVAVKLGPFFTAFGDLARQLVDAGANGLVLFNRFYQPDFDLEKQLFVPNLTLSDSNELRLPLHWIALLHNRLPIDLAITSGVHTYEDVLKGLMAGANVTMMASELLQNGVQRIGEIVRAMVLWMEEHEYQSIAQIRGCMSQANIVEPTAFERANYMKMLQAWQY